MLRSREARLSMHLRINLGEVTLSRLAADSGLICYQHVGLAPSLANYGRISHHCRGQMPDDSSHFHIQEQLQLHCHK